MLCYVWFMSFLLFRMYSVGFDFMKIATQSQAFAICTIHVCRPVLFFYKKKKSGFWFFFAHSFFLIFFWVLFFFYRHWTTHTDWMCSRDIGASLCSCQRCSDSSQCHWQRRCQWIQSHKPVEQHHVAIRWSLVGWDSDFWLQSVWPCWQYWNM